MSPKTHFDHAISKALIGQDEKSIEPIKNWLIESLGKELPVIKTLQQLELSTQLTTEQSNAVVYIINCLSKINAQFTAKALTGGDPSTIQSMSCTAVAVKHNLKFTKINLVSDKLLERALQKAPSNDEQAIRAHLGGLNSMFFHTTFFGVYIVKTKLTVLVPVSQNFPVAIHKYQAYAARLIANEIKNLEGIVGKPVAVSTVSIDSKTLNHVVGGIQDATHIEAISKALVSISEPIGLTHITFEQAIPLSREEYQIILNAKTRPSSASTVSISGATQDNISKEVFELSKEFKLNYERLVEKARYNLPSNVAELSNMLSLYPEQLINSLYNKTLLQLNLVDVFGYSPEKVVSFKTTKDLFIEIITLSERQGTVLQPVLFEHVGDVSMDLEIH